MYSQMILASVLILELVASSPIPNEIKDDLNFPLSGYSSETPTELTEPQYEQPSNVQADLIIPSPINSAEDQETYLVNLNDLDVAEKVSSADSGDLKGEETFYPGVGIFWGFRPWGGWGGYRPGWNGWHGWHRPGGSWGGHWGGHWGGGRWR